MEAVPWVAWIGACTGVASLGWNVYTRMTAGPHLRVSALPGMKQMPPPAGNPTFLSVSVRNVGTAPTTLTNLSLQVYDSRWKRMRHMASSNFVVVNYVGPALPFKLDVGAEWRAFMRQDEGFDELLATGKLWCGVWHSFSTKAVESKVVQPRIKM
ncbi:MAG: hypothetical protein IT159_11445 [Bryobacterales bacterium]|nr:hypothetical protein [Bryobacterales bacterium]